MEIVLTPALVYRKVLGSCTKIFVYSIVGWESLWKRQTSHHILWLLSLYFDIQFHSWSGISRSSSQLRLCF